MKHIIILGDGMADHPLPQLGGRTLLQAAHTPWMDLLARQGRNGRLVTVAPGFHPGSEVANMSVLGYDLPTVYEGRGPLEAASIGVDLAPGDMAMRCNLVCLEGDLLKNHSAGHITTEEADTLIRFLQERLGDERVHFYTGVQYRHLLVIRGGDKRLDCTPPHDVPLQPWRPLLPKAECPEAQQTADLLDTLILRSQDLLRDHPLNKQRIAQGKDPANSIWPWSPGYRPQMEPFSARFPQVRDTPYWPFVRDYAGDRYEAVCRTWSDFTDRACAGLSPERQKACLEIFRACSLHELRFWEMSAKPRADL